MIRPPNTHCAPDIASLQHGPTETPAGSTMTSLKVQKGLYKIDQHGTFHLSRPVRKRWEFLPLSDADARALEALKTSVRALESSSFHPWIIMGQSMSSVQPTEGLSKTSIVREVVVALPAYQMRPIRMALKTYLNNADLPPPVDYQLDAFLFLLKCEDPPHNVVRIENIFYDAHQQVHVLMEKMERGSVQDLLDRLKRTGPPSHLPSVCVATIAAQIVDGLYDLHRNGFVHRNLKASNILIGKNGLVKIGDFSVMKHLPTAEGNPTEFMAFLLYMSPEGARKDTRNKSSDVWGLGALTAEMTFGGFPFVTVGDVEAFEERHPREPITLDTPRLVLPPKHHGRLVDGTVAMDVNLLLGRLAPRALWTPEQLQFIQRCLIVDPDMRPSAVDLRSHAFLQTKNPVALAAY